MRIAIGCLVLFLTVGSALGQTAQVQRIDIVEYGLYAVDRLACQRDVRGVERCGWLHTKTTSAVPAEIGLAFGVRFRVVGTPDGAQVSLSRDWLFPDVGLRPPAPNPPSRRMDRTFPATIGNTGLILYTLDNPWELVPGPWILEFWYEGRKLASSTFTMVKQ
ncbi:MAG TPA: DUF3859 domain-containing protein [Stellaceae bacterium]|jgi:hypothetical protein|nr:DUF3859 domain-containing protein [Stellaceae bacterium]